MKCSLIPQLSNIRVVPIGGILATKPPSADGVLADRETIVARFFSPFRSCFSLAALFGTPQRTLPTRYLLCGLALCAFFSKGALAQTAEPVGGKWVLISLPTTSPCLGKTPFFDGAISPFSYTGAQGQTVVQIPASVGATNFRYTGSLVNGELAANFVIDCQGMYTAQKSQNATLFRWAEWLYGFYRSPETGYVYSTIYNEYYGGDYTSPVGGLMPNGCRQDHPAECNYSGIGLARSVDNGKTFQPIVPAPGHVIARVPYLYYPNAGHGMGTAFEGGGNLFANPNDGYLYRMLNQFKDTPTGDYGVTIMRTRKEDIDDPTSWRVWDGAGYNIAFSPSGAYGATIALPCNMPFYLGWSAYFQTYIATGLCDPYNYCFTWSNDLIHWSSSGIIIMPIDPQSTLTSGSGLPSLLDPSYLAQTGDGSAANGGIVGRDPYLTFVRGQVPSPNKQQVAVQRLHFNDPTPPSVSITTPTNGAQLGLSAQVSATASDNMRVVGVQFKLDADNFGNEVTVAEQGVFSTTGSLTGKAGNHILTAVARDGAGNTTTSAGVAVTVLLTGTITASPNPCVPPPGGYCNTFVSWNSTAPDAAVWVNDLTGIGFWYGIGCGPSSGTPVQIPVSGSVRVGLYANISCSVPYPPSDPPLAQVIVNPDTTLPDVNVTNPFNNAVVRGAPAVTGTTSDNTGVAGVQVKLDCPGPSCVNVANEVLNPGNSFSVRWITSATTDGPHTLTAVARDWAGNTRTSSPVSLTVDNTPPTAWITSPTNGALVGGTITVIGAASDNIGVSGVQLLLDDAPLGGFIKRPPYSASWNTTSAPPGTQHTLKAQARDAGGNITTSAPVTVTVTGNSDS
jgi:hypothetical protein